MAFDITALLSDVPNLGTGRDQIEYIRLSQLDEDPNNFYQLSEIPELAANIQLCGLQQPIRVRRNDAGRYQIVSGHRRRAALELLAQEDPKRWEEVPCIIEHDEASENLQQLRLIYANAHTRVMTPAETSRQAEAVTDLLYKLKDEGYEFPGRMRDHVAKAVGISKSKLARLKVIRERLSAEWMPLFERDAIAEATANHLAQLEEYDHHLIYEFCRERYGAPEKVFASMVDHYKRRMEEVRCLICPSDGVPCENIGGKRDLALRKGQYEFFSCGKCCSGCYNLLSCKHACPKLAEDIARQKAERKAAEKQAKEDQKARDADKVESIRNIWKRFGLLRNAAEVTVQQVVEAGGSRYNSVHDKRYLVNEAGSRVIVE